MLFAVALSVVAYLLGSVPWGLVVAKVFCGIDPRLDGSRNTGATNVARLCGFGWGVLTLLCDILKGCLPVLLAVVEDAPAPAVTAVALAAVLGHVFSCFMGFRGGKAVSTTIGVLLPVAFLPTLVSSVLCMLVIWRSGFVSAGSLTLVGTLPVVLCVFGDFRWVPLSLCLLVLVAWRHRENIARLRAGTEKPWLRSARKEAGAR